MKYFLILLLLFCGHFAQATDGANGGERGGDEEHDFHLGGSMHCIDAETTSKEIWLVCFQETCDPNAMCEAQNMKWDHVQARR